MCVQGKSTFSIGVIFGDKTNNPIREQCLKAIRLGMRLMYWERDGCTGTGVLGMRLVYWV